MKERHLFDVRDIESLSRHSGESQIRDLCESHYLGNNEILARCLGRYKMYLDTRGSGFVPHILMDGFWEYWITQFMVATVKPGMTFIDVGANYGYYTLLLSDLVGPQGRGIAVEPNPQISVKLQRSIAVNGYGDRISVEQVALGAETAGQTLLCIPPFDPMNARVVSANSVSPEPADETVPVSTTSIDHLCRDLDRVDLIKIDAEGAEANILDGMTKTIQLTRPHIVMECNAVRNYDIVALHERLSVLYGKVSFIDFDGKTKPITAHELATRDVGNDWMIYCARSR